VRRVRPTVASLEVPLENRALLRRWRALCTMRGALCVGALTRLRFLIDSLSHSQSSRSSNTPRQRRRTRRLDGAVLHVNSRRLHAARASRPSRPSRRIGSHKPRNRNRRNSVRLRPHVPEPPSRACSAVAKQQSLTIRDPRPATGFFRTGVELSAHISILAASHRLRLSATWTQHDRVTS
jgi:hypothetical protein